MDQHTAANLRLASPLQLGFCVGIFFLPWVEIQCGTRGTRESPPLLWQGVVEQSGFQAASGSCTALAPPVRTWVDEYPDRRPEPAPLLWVYLGAATVGAVLGFVLPVGVARKSALVVCCTLALGSVAGQGVIGFPITERYLEYQEEAERQQAAEGQRAAVVLRPAIQFWYYAALAFAAGALVTSLLDPGEIPRRRPRRRREPDDDDDDRDRERHRDDERLRRRRRHDD